MGRKYARKFQPEPFAKPQAADISHLCASIVIRQRVNLEDDHFKFIGRVRSYAWAFSTNASSTLTSAFFP
jgi:hypothetical protein